MSTRHVITIQKTQIKSICLQIGNFNPSCIANRPVKLPAVWVTHIRIQTDWSCQIDILSSPFLPVILINLNGFKSWPGSNTPVTAYSKMTENVTFLDRIIYD